MLPGFRFLFAATVLTVSLLIFGLGAAALLRASHERFAGLPMRPPQTATFTQPEDAPPPTLAILRVEPAPIEAPATLVPVPMDTLLPTDRLAALSTASRSEDVVQPPLIVEPPSKIEPAPAPPIEAVAETMVTPPVVVPAEPIVTMKTEEPPSFEAPAAVVEAPQQVAALPEPEIATGGIAELAPGDPPLVNATPIKRPPLPSDRPAAADAVAAMSASDIARPIVRKRKPVVKRVVVQKPRAVVRARPRQPGPRSPNPASPFGAPGFGGSPFGT